jgi:hypothetical protein
MTDDKPACGSVASLGYQNVFHNKPFYPYSKWHIAGKTKQNKTAVNPSWLMKLENEHTPFQRSQLKLARLW